MTDATDEAELLGRIIKAAGRRQAAPEATRERVLHAASAALEAKLQRHRRFRVRSWAAAAAVVVAAAGIVLQSLRSVAPAPVALSDQFVGEAFVREDPAAAWSPLPRDRKLPDGSELRTGAGGRIGLVLDNGASVRVDELTRIRLETPTRIHVLTGAVYVDSGRPGARASPAHRIEIVTADAITREVGTQFEVSYREGLHRLRVREGQVVMSLGGTAIRGQAGEELLVAPGGEVRRGRISASDTDWQWVELVAHTPDIDNRPLSEVLQWVSRETGRPIRYATPAVKATAGDTILHGSIRNLAPLPAARTVLATTDLDLEILPDGSLLVKARHPGEQ